MKKSLVVSAVVTLAVILLIGIWFSLKPSTDSNLEKARNFVRIGETEKAVELYQSFLMSHSDSIGPGLEYAKLLEGLGSYEKEEKVLDSLEFKGSRSQREEVAWAEVNFYTLLGAKCLRIGEADEDSGKWHEAVSDLKTAQTFFSKENQYMMSVYSNADEESRHMFQHTDSLDSHPVKQECWVELAYASWLNGEKELPMENFSGEDSLGDIKFAEKLNKLGESQFEARDYGKAEHSWRESLLFYEVQHRSISDSDHLLAEIQYNIAMALLNHKYFEDGVNELRDLQTKAPAYEPEKVKKKILFFSSK